MDEDEDEEAGSRDIISSRLVVGLLLDLTK